MKIRAVGLTGGVGWLTRNTREADHGIEGQLHLLGSQRANHLDRNVEDGARMDRQM